MSNGHGYALPALYVAPDIEGYFSGEDGQSATATLRERQKKRCTPLLQQPKATDQIGTTVFPGQVVEFGSGIGITPAQIASAADADKATGHKTDFILPWGVGCIRYRSPDGISHQTGIAFTIGSIKPGIDLPVALPVDPTTVDPKLLLIEKWIDGGSAYAN